MAIFESSLFFRLRNSLGNVVTYTYCGKGVLRGKPLCVRNPRTPHNRSFVCGSKRQADCPPISVKSLFWDFPLRMPFSPTTPLWVLTFPYSMWMKTCRSVPITAGWSARRANWKNPLSRCVFPATESGRKFPNSNYPPIVPTPIPFTPFCGIANTRVAVSLK